MRLPALGAGFGGGDKGDRQTNSGPSSRQTWLTVAEPGYVAPLIAVLSSDLFWWWYTVTSNCRHLNPIDLHRFPLPASLLADAELLRRHEAAFPQPVAILPGAGLVGLEAAGCRGFDIQGKTLADQVG